MHTVGGVNLEFLLAALFNDLVNAGRTITLRGFIKLGQVVRHRDRVVLQLQVRWLVFFVVGARQEDR